MGTALGDALGLPREWLPVGRATKWYGTAPLSMRLVLGRGMVSDDTEHACLTAQALLAAGEDPAAFARSLAWRLRGWLLALPGGVGLATAKGIVRLWLGFPPDHSGVRSAGNGPAMRAPIVGACIDDTAQLRALIRASTRLTHTDPRAEQGALAVALAARAAVRADAGGLDPAAVLAAIRAELADAELDAALAQVDAHLGRAAEAAELAAALGLSRGVSGYIHHTVPVALFCWLRWPGDLRRAVEEAVLLGGDTDTVGGIVGALAGATRGEAGLPAEWLATLWEWPRSAAWMRALGERLARRFGPEAEPVGPLPLFWPAVPLRNALFLLLVLAHGCRRLLPF